MFRHGLSLATALGILIVGVLVSIALLFAIVAGSTFKKSFHQHIDRQVELRLDGLTSQFIIYIDSHLDILRSIANNPITTQNISQENKDSAYLRDYLGNVRIAGENYRLVLFDENGKAIYDTQPNTFLPDQKQLLNLMIDKERRMAHLSSRLSQSSVLWLVVAIRGASTTQGALAVEIPIDHITPFKLNPANRFLEQISIYKKGELIYQVGQVKQGYDLNQNISRLGAYIQYRADISALVSHQKMLFRRFMLLGTMMAALIALIAYYAAKRLIIFPLKSLQEQASLIRRGIRPSGAVASSLIAEIHGLTGQFFKMANDVLDTREHLENLVKARTEALEVELSIRRETEEALKNSEANAQKLANVASRTGNIVVITDSQGFIEWVNDSFIRITGYTFHEALGRKPGHLLQGEETDLQAVQFMREQIASGKGFRVELVNYTREKQKYWVDVEVQPVYDAAGHVIHFIAIEDDITERKQKEEQLLLARRIFENAGEAIVVTDAQGCIVDVNPAYERITGYSYTEAVEGKQTILPALSDEDKSLSQEIWEMLRMRGHWEGEMRGRRKNQESYPQWLSISVLRDEQNHIGHYIGIFLDISQQKATEVQLERLAFYDLLTGLPNRALFRDRLKLQINQTIRHHQPSALFFIDLDRFKYVNDTLGHEAGDQLLIEVAQRIHNCLRESDTVARLGGDEFTVIIPNQEDIERVGEVAARIIAALKAPFMIKGSEVFIGASIGIAICPNDGEDFETLTKNADVAMYKAKESGRETYRFFTSDMNEQNNIRLELEGELHHALECHEFSLYYQPKVDITQNKIVGMEALVRWIHPQKGIIPPLNFIPLAEETGLIVPIGAWTLETACRDVKRWNELGFNLRVAVNLSARQFEDPHLLENIKSILKRVDLEPGCLEIEITESVVMKDVAKAIHIIDELKTMGLYISIDDFGTGYSSLSYLKKFPIHALKIDQSFVNDLNRDHDNAAIVSCIISMAKAMRLGVVAEGVEESGQLAFLRTETCEQAQGYYFSKPMPASEFEQMLLEHADSIDPSGSDGTSSH